MTKEMPLLAGLLLCCLQPFVALGQGDSEDIGPVTRTIAFTNATIMTQPGDSLVGGTIVLKDGLIEAVGTGVSIPPGARVIEADSMYIYAGFIDGFSHIGLPRPEPNQDRERPDDPGNPSYEQAGIQPERLLRDLLDPDEDSVEDFREQGFTAAQVAGYGNMLPGQTGLILLGGDSPEQMLYVPQTGLFAQLDGARGVFPATVIGVMTKFRELYRQAEQAKAHQTAYRQNAAGMKRPQHDRVHEAFFPVIDGTYPIVFLAEDVKTIHRALALQRDLGFPLMLAGVKESWQVKDQLAEAEVPLFLSLDLPEEPKKGDEDEETDPERQKLEERRQEEMQRFMGQAAALKEAGLAFGFSLADLKANDLKANLRRLMAHGLSEADVLAALTTVPAGMLGVGATMGTLEPGKLANVVVANGPYFAEDSQVRYVLVEGRLHEYETKKRSAGESTGDPAQVAGKWSYSIEGTGQSMEGTLNLVDNGGSLEGQISNPMNGQSGDIQNIVLTGKRVSFEMPFSDGGDTMTVYFSLEFDGETFEGTIDTGQYGSFPVEGAKLGDPE